MKDISSYRGNASFPPWRDDYIPTADEWLNCFSNKADSSSIEDLKKSLFPDKNVINDTIEQNSILNSILSRVTSLENEDEYLSSLCYLIKRPYHYITGTYDDVDETFFSREQASIAVKLSSQLAWAANQQQQARFTQRLIVEAKKAGLYK